ncbi:uncharacterized protein EV422DRAFT_514945 [Fimicolochytrium jonesii]|uniref:uncharacterized protein n=1 Tax=Fimicolochytrium jonesii TaxID=1396493 RepID=UPI0022FE59D6|nr:uncharacterized protein EV422DRAFT_514945 [Fimicolochytrium jonesii]KAI8825991.1 hypothetical protein EV422DRAFT_514945 [Fimicolochytrium jonesii]
MGTTTGTSGNGTGSSNGATPKSTPAKGSNLVGQAGKDSGTNASTPSTILKTRRSFAAQGLTPIVKRTWGGETAVTIAIKPVISTEASPEAPPTSTTSSKKGTSTTKARTPSAEPPPTTAPKLKSSVKRKSPSVDTFPSEKKAETATDGPPHHRKKLKTRAAQTPSPNSEEENIDSSNDSVSHSEAPPKRRAKPANSAIAAKASRSNGSKQSNGDVVPAQAEKTTPGPRRNAKRGASTSLPSENENNSDADNTRKAPEQTSSSAALVPPNKRATKKISSGESRDKEADEGNGDKAPSTTKKGQSRKGANAKAKEAAVQEEVVDEEEGGQDEEKKGILDDDFRHDNGDAERQDAPVAELAPAAYPSQLEVIPPPTRKLPLNQALQMLSRESLERLLHYSVLEATRIELADIADELEASGALSLLPQE